MLAGMYAGGLALAGAARLREAVASVTLNVNNTTGSKVVFTVTGVVLIEAFYGVVTTIISSNHTAGHIRLNDQTATLDLSEAATGITLSNFEVGTLIFKESLLATALQSKRADVGFIEESAAAGTPAFTRFIVGKKNGATTTLDYRYSTTNAPSSGAIRFGALWLPLSADGNLA